MLKHKIYESTHLIFIAFVMPIFFDLYIFLFQGEFMAGIHKNGRS